MTISRRAIAEVIKTSASPAEARERLTKLDHIRGGPMTVDLRPAKYCRCARRHRSRKALTECLWPWAEWIVGDGQYALLAHCRVLTVTLYKTLDAAVSAKQVIDQSACGGGCSRCHEIIDVDPRGRFQPAAGNDEVGKVRTMRLIAASDVKIRAVRSLDYDAGYRAGVAAATANARLGA